MIASGTDIWSTADEFHFAYKEATGAVTVIAKVESVENMDLWAKAGVMIRDTLEPDSVNAALLITPGNGVRFQFRRTTGGITDRNFVEGITAPQWVKLERTVGGLVRASHSADGSAWTQVGMSAITMNMPLYIGLALTSHEAKLTCEAKFSNVSITGTGVGAQWTDLDIGIASNDAESMYVTVGDGSGTAATVYHDNPAPTQIDTWTEWNIPLADLSNAGVVLTDVSKLAIGFGDKSNPQPGGLGLMYFDDIRLYLPAPQP
jgi:regulation of enolase protein 1 (concanavalin A-like superfamily)